MVVAKGDVQTETVQTATDNDNGTVTDTTTVVEYNDKTKEVSLSET